MFWLLLGVLLAIVSDATLGSLWVLLGWAGAVRDWLLARGLSDAVAAYAGLVWLQIPDWVVLVAAGAVVGRVWGSGPWLRCALAVGLGYVAHSYVVLAYLQSLAGPDSVLDADVLLLTTILGAVSLFLILLAAWLFARPRRGDGEEPAAGVEG